jgi:hypothetical protein
MAACKSRLVGCSYHADIGLDGSIPADALKFVFLQNAQEGDLCFGGKLSDFIEKDGAASRQFKAPYAPLQRTREGAFLMSE